MNATTKLDPEVMKWCVNLHETSCHEVMIRNELTYLP